MEYYEEEKTKTNSENEFEIIGCGFCWDRKKKRSKELFFLDAANNMRVCNFCPYCGRSYEE